MLVENFKPGTMEAMGLGHALLRAENPAPDHGERHRFRQFGSRRPMAGFDQIAQGYSGLMSLTGTIESGPMRVGVAIGDSTAGMWAALGVLGAVIARHGSGVGQHVETSLLAGLIGLLNVQAQRHLSLGEISRAERQRPSGDCALRHLSNARRSAQYRNRDAGNVAQARRMPRAGDVDP